MERWGRGGREGGGKRCGKRLGGRVESERGMGVEGEKLGGDTKAKGSDWGK